MNTDPFARRGMAVIAVAVLMVFCGCAAKKKASPIVYQLRNCQVIERANVTDNDGSKHTELSCECSHRSERLDAKTGKRIVECE